MVLKQRLWHAFTSPAYPKWLLGSFGLWFAAWAVNPPHPGDFLLEHAFTAAFVALLCWTHNRFRLSNLSYTAIFLYLCLHVVGAHYTYSEVPYEDWLRWVGARFGAADFSLRGLFGVERNHYDRLVHFCFGLLMAYPVREVFVRIVRVRGFWAYYLPLDVMMSISLLYELIEWGTVVVGGEEVGQNYLGTQGDPWDAQKDMALATLGGLVTMSLTALVNWWYGRDFAGEMARSFREKRSRPLGEVKLAEMADGRKTEEQPDQKTKPPKPRTKSPRKRRPRG